jgi:hypothetical protein
MPPGLFSERFAGSVSEFLGGISETGEERRVSKPVVMALDDAYPHDGTRERIREFREAGALAYGSIRRASRALRRVSDYGQFLAESADPPERDPSA